VSEPSSEELLWNLTRGALATRALAVVSELGVADALASGPRPVAEVASEVGADPETLHRFLRALASDGVFAEDEPGVFRNTAASELLRDAWDDFAHLFGGVFYGILADLDASGEPTFPRLYGTDFWSWLAAHPDERASFDRAMGQGQDSRIERLQQVEWRGDETVVDVGGGNGSLLVELLKLEPGLRGVVFDLPETVRDEAALGELGIEFVEGSFFERVPEGEVYILGTILHDWDDEAATAILRSIRAAAPEDSRLLVIDSVVQPGNEPGGSKWLDLLMLAFAGGKERNESQWRDLFAAGGFEPVRFHPALIEARCR
jgi:O-methyltransferase domain/Dimerisation domain